MEKETDGRLAIKCGLFAVLSVALSISLSVLYSDVGNAQTIWDEIELSDGLYVHNGRDQVDLLAGFESIQDRIQDLIDNEKCIGDCETRLQQFNFAMDNGYYSITSRTPANPSSSNPVQSSHTVTIYFTTGVVEDFEYVSFNNDLQEPTIRHNEPAGAPNKLFGIQFYMDNDGELFATASSFTTFLYKSGIRLNDPNYSTYKVLPYLTTFPIEYPEGYEGPEIPGGSLINKLETFAPDFQYTYNNLNLWASDHEQDLPVFEPDLEGYTDDGYRVEWTVWECRGGEWYAETSSCNGGQTELLKLETLGLNESFTFNVPELGEYRLQAEYRVSQCYRYESYPETPDHCFSSSPSVEPNLDYYEWERRAVIIDMDGSAGGGDTLEMECGHGGFNCDPSTADGNMLPCFTRDFPYVNVNNCIKNVFTLFDVLTFRRQSIFGFSTNTLECKPIPRIGDWMNLENRYICPQFPGQVRDLVTPFITLTLGMFMVVFISRISRETYN